jgi:hypothetical protein
MAVHAIKTDNYLETIRIKKDIMIQLLSKRVNDSLNFLAGKSYLRTGVAQA